MPTSSRGGCRIPARNKAAFTLIEVLAVLALVAVASGIVLVQVGSSPVRTAERSIELLRDIRQIAMRTAVERQERLLCQFDADLRRVVLVTASTNASLRRWEGIDVKLLTSKQPVEVTTDGQIDDIVVEVRRERSRYVMLLGVSGEVVEFDDERQVNQLLDVLRTDGTGVHTP